MYVKSHDPKSRNFLTWLPELPCNVTRTCLADLLSSWDIYRFLFALARHQYGLNQSHVWHVQCESHIEKSA